MNILGFSITRQQKAVPDGYAAVQPRNVWQSIFRYVQEPFTGAWQRNVRLPVADPLSSGPVFACVTLIASDIAKLEPKLKALGPGGIWSETTNSSYSAVLRRPNHYQNRIVFLMSWAISKLTAGNTYILKKRNAARKVDGLYPLDPNRVTPLVAPNGDVYYQVNADTLAQTEAVAIPASEIIHDIMYPIFHPLVGLSPLHAAGLAAVQGLRIRQNSTALFENYSQISGTLTTPHTITDETAKRLAEDWQNNYAGPENAGKIVVLGDGLKFEPMGYVNPRDSQMVEQSKESAIEVCNAYHVPAWMVGYGPEPTYANGEARYQQYYSQCLQVLIEAIELLLDEGLGLSSELTVELDLDGLLRMDTSTKMDVATKGLSGVLSPDEARKMFNLAPKPGGDDVYLQQQNFSLSALRKRDQQENPFGSATAAPASSGPAADPADDEPRIEDADADKAAEVLRKELAA